MTDRQTGIARDRETETDRRTDRQKQGETESERVREKGGGVGERGTVREGTKEVID